jgi:hypothetical protein
MRVYARNLVAFQSNYLKPEHSLPQDRFSDLDRAESVNRLERLADVRSPVILRGKALIGNPDYPEQKVIRQISLLFAEKWRA